VLVIEILIDAPDAPALKLPELAEIVKSPTWTTAEVDCVKVPGKPLATIVTVYVPAVVESRVQADGAFALAVTLTGTIGHVTVRAVEEENPVKFTLPEKS
jgi:hypothetical protein